MNQDEKKRQAAIAALQYIPEGALLGIGTGSTVNFFIDALPDIRGKISALASSSEASTARLNKLGFDVVELSETGDLDLYVDGADEANPHFHLIKGGGGALTREKIVAAAARKFICIVDDSKMVDVLGAFPLPIEVIPMARSYVARQLIKAGGKPEYRAGFVTDNGNEILDVHGLNITNAPELEGQINQIAGVVTVGLFARRGADILLIATENGVETLEK